MILYVLGGRHCLRESGLYLWTAEAWNRTDELAEWITHTRRNPFLVVYLSENLTLLYRLPGRTLKRSRRNCVKIITIPRTIWQIIPISAVLPSGDIHIWWKCKAFILERKSDSFKDTGKKAYAHHSIDCSHGLLVPNHRVWGIVYSVSRLCQSLLSGWTFAPHFLLLYSMLRVGWRSVF